MATTMEDEDKMAPSQSALPQLDKKLTLKQAFYKRCYKEYNKKNQQQASVENDMLLKGISDKDKQALIDHYEYVNNPLIKCCKKYYMQYHAFDLVVFKQYSVMAWNSIVEFFKDSQQLHKKYSKNLRYMLQRQRQCNKSYSTIVKIIIAYPCHHQKTAESCDQFLID